MRDVRPTCVDDDLQLQFSLQMQVETDGVIKVRSKRAMSARVKWSSWHQMMPVPGMPDESLPHRNTVPDMAEPKEWPEFKKDIVPKLRSFYNRRFAHPVVISDSDKGEMLSFLQDGPVPASAPAWIDWDKADCGSRPETVVDPVALRLSAPEPSRKVWRPFMQPRVNPDGRKCKCGSTAHLKITHSLCPLNPKRVRKRARENAGAEQENAPPRDRARAASRDKSANESEDESSSDSDEDILLRDMIPSRTTRLPFPFPIGTRVAVKFSRKVYAGKITSVFSDTGTGLVLFSDGDQAEYTPDELREHIALYQQKFGDKHVRL